MENNKQYLVKHPAYWQMHFVVMEKPMICKIIVTVFTLQNVLNPSIPSTLMHVMN